MHFRPPNPADGGHGNKVRLQNEVHCKKYGQYLQKTTGNSVDDATK